MLVFILSLIWWLKRTYNQGLGEPEGEDELGASHQQLGGQSLEEGSWALVLGHVGNNLETRLWVLKVSHLDAGLDDIERSGDDEGGGSTTDGCNKVLVPGSGVVVLEVEDELLSSGGTTKELHHMLAIVPSGCVGYLRRATYSERARGVSGGSPLPSTVQSHTLIGNDLEKTTALESLWVGLTLDLQDVQWEEDNLSNTDQRTSSGGHDGLSGTLTESILEGSSVVVGKVIASEWLTTVLIDTLENLVTGGVTESGEEGEELLSGGGVGVVLEDNGIELSSVGNLELSLSAILLISMLWVLQAGVG